MIYISLSLVLQSLLAAVYSLKDQTKNMHCIGSYDKKSFIYKAWERLQKNVHLKDAGTGG